MPQVNMSVFAEPGTFLRDPQDVAHVMRDPRFAVGQLAGYLDDIMARGGPSFPNLLGMARHAFAFQSGTQHLNARRTAAPFFSSNGVAQWEPVIEKAVAAALDGLATAKSPDLMRDYCEAATLTLMRSFVGCPGGTDARLLELIRLTNNITQPMLSLRKMREMEAALAELLTYISADPPTDGQPEGLRPFLEARADRLNGPDAANYTALATLVGSHTLAQSLSSALCGMLMRGKDYWLSAAQPGWMESEAERIMSNHPSALVFVRLAEEDVALGGCPFHKGDAAVMNLAAANAELRRRAPDGRSHLSFGTGPHKCPGAPISYLFFSHAIPRLVRAFPDLALQRDGVRHHVTPMVRYPNVLPVVRDGHSTRISGRMVEIRDIREARGIVNDDATFSPPAMEPHLRSLGARSGRDMKMAIRIARNAMFFMSGPRHAAIRREVADCLGGNRMARWQGFIEAQVQLALDALAAAPRPDLIADFCDPLFRGIAGPILGLTPRDPARFHQLAPILQDVLEPWLPMRELDRLQEVFAELLDLFDTPATDGLPGEPLLARLQRAQLPETDATDLKALVLVLYGASFNLSHTLGNILHHLLTLPPEERDRAADPAWIEAELESLISLCASPKYIYRMARRDTRVGDLDIRAQETLRLQLLTIDRGVAAGNLAFGHGLHRCVGAALSKRMLRTALPAFFARFPTLELLPQDFPYQELSQTVALAALPCRIHSKTKDPL